jgi:hypothetical protein
MAQSTGSMTISQGLRKLKKLKGLLAEAQARATQSTSWADEAKPVFDFAAERAKRAELQDEIVRIETGIARANALTRITVEDREMPIAEAIRRLQELKADLAWLPTLNLRAGTEKSVEYDYDEVTGRNVPRTKSVVYTAVMSQPERVVEIQALRDRFDVINDALETANHRTLIEVEPKPAKAEVPSAA